MAVHVGLQYAWVWTSVIQSVDRMSLVKWPRMSISDQICYLNLALLFPFSVPYMGVVPQKTGGGGILWVRPLWAPHVPSCLRVGLYRMLQMLCLFRGPGRKKDEQLLEYPGERENDRYTLHTEGNSQASTQPRFGFARRPEAAANLARATCLWFK